MSTGGAAQARGPAGALGFVLAGGRSRRMGRDKALLPWGDRTLLEHAIARLTPLCAEIFLLTGAEPRYAETGLVALPDVERDAGPLGGVLAGLERLDERPGLFLAVDVPHVPTSLLAHMLALQSGHDAVVPQHAQGAEPLVAVYMRACAAPARRQLAAGERRLTSFWPDVELRLLSDAELRLFGDPGEMFANVNTPEQYAGSTAGATLSGS